MKIIKLPKASLQTIYHYFHLSIGGKEIPCPYYINEDYPLPIFEKSKIIPSKKLAYRKKQSKSRAMVGKGKPTEIEKVTKELAQKNKFDLKQANVLQIRKFMVEHGIGVDCSALVVWALNELSKEKFDKPLWKFINFGKRNVFRRLLITLRPAENIGVKVLNANSQEIKNIHNVQPGDLIISWNNQHVLLITEVGFENDKPKYFKYVNSTWWYGDGGVKEGTVNIKNSGSLLNQDWSEVLYKGKNWTYEGIKEGGKLVRLSIFLL